MSDHFERLRRTAHHEAGHAVAGLAIGLRVVLMSIDARMTGGASGVTRFEPSPGTWAGDDDERRLLAARVYRAGLEAERRLCGWAPHIETSGSAMDELEAFGVAGRRHEEAKGPAAELVAERWRDIERLAAALLERRTLDAEGVSAALHSDGVAQSSE